MKPGRNDPCPCGSGRKYKQCCLHAAQPAASDPSELVWRRVRRALEGFSLRMLRFISEHYGPVALPEAWEEFTLWQDEPFDPEHIQMPVFMPWFFHRWSPDPKNTDVADAALHGVTPAQHLLQRKSKQLDPALRQYLESCLAMPFSFYEVLKTQPGYGLELRDLFTGEHYTVRERSASGFLQPGDLAYAQLAQVQQVALLAACTPVVIPPLHKIELLQMRAHMRSSDPPLTKARLRDWDQELRQIYLDIADELLHPPTPELRTTDGEKLVPQTLVFDIESAEEALMALKSLDGESTESSPREAVERDPAGTLVRAVIAWKKPGNALHKHWQHTLLGHIEITPGRMTATVHSNERAAALRQIVEERLGSRARYRLSEIQPTESLLTQPPPTATPDAKQEALMQSPEARALMQDFLARHYEDWVEQKIPVLGGRTPLEVVKTPEGREQVEALVRDIERRSENMPIAPDPAIFRRLRERLGLTPRAQS